MSALLDWLFARLVPDWAFDLLLRAGAAVIEWATEKCSSPGGPPRATTDTP